MYLCGKYEVMEKEKNLQRQIDILYVIVIIQGITLILWGLLGFLD